MKGLLLALAIALPVPQASEQIPQKEAPLLVCSFYCQEKDGGMQCMVPPIICQEVKK